MFSTVLLCQTAVLNRKVTDETKALPNMPAELYQKILEDMLCLHIGEYRDWYKYVFSEELPTKIFTGKLSLFGHVQKLLDNKSSS